MQIRYAGFGAAFAVFALWYTARGAGVFDAPADVSSDWAPAGGGDVENDQPGIVEQMANTVINAAVATSSLSDAGLVMLARLEGFSATPYWDHAGYSIGYGHLIKPGESFTVIDESKARELLRADVGIAERAVSAVVSAPVTQNQFDALVLLCFNIGVTAFKSSTLVRLLNAGDVQGAADQFARWNKVTQGGALMVDNGLVSRRSQEVGVFNGGLYA